MYYCVLRHFPVKKDIRIKKSSAVTIYYSYPPYNIQEIKIALNFFATYYKFIINKLNILFSHYVTFVQNLL